MKWNIWKHQWHEALQIRACATLAEGAGEEETNSIFTSSCNQPPPLNLNHTISKSHIKDFGIYVCAFIDQFCLQWNWDFLTQLCYSWLVLGQKPQKCSFCLHDFGSHGLGAKNRGQSDHMNSLSCNSSRNSKVALLVSQLYKCSRSIVTLPGIKTCHLAEWTRRHRQGHPPPIRHCYTAKEERKKKYTAL